MIDDVDEVDDSMTLMTIDDCFLGVMDGKRQGPRG